jgi:hypothetical protein
MTKLRKRFGVLSIATALAVFGGGSAFAYWTVNGFGSSTATVADVKPLVITPVAIKGLVLGHSALLSGKVTNPNEFEVDLTGKHFTVTPAVDSHHSGCLVTDFKIVAPNTSAKLVLASSSVNFGGGTITLLNASHDQTACQGAVVTLQYALR